MKTILSVLLTLTIILSCSTPPKGEELVKRYMNDSVFSADRGIYDIQVLSFDSLFSRPSDDLSYRNILDNATKSLNEAKMNYDKCDKWMNSWWSNDDDYPLSLPLVDFHLKLFREDLAKLKEMNKVFKSKHIGFLCYCQAKYKTSFSDSLVMGEFTLSVDKKKFTKKPDIAYPIPIGEDITWLMDLKKQSDLDFLEYLAKDTLSLEIPIEWREAYAKAHPSEK